MNNQNRRNGKPNPDVWNCRLRGIAVILLCAVGGLILGGVAVLFDSSAGVTAGQTGMIERLVENWRHYRFTWLALVASTTLLGLLVYSRRFRWRCRAEGSHEGEPGVSRLGSEQPRQEKTDSSADTGSSIFDLYDLSPIAFLLVDRLGEICSANDRAADLLGHPKRELVGTQLADLAVDRDRGRSAAAHLVERSAVDHQTRECEIEMKTAGEKVCWIGLSSRPVLDRHGRALLMGVVAIDVSERKRAEEALRESEESFRALYENAPVPYQSLDADGMIVQVNDAWCHAFGFDKGEVVGRPMKELLTPESRDDFRERFPAFKQLGEVTGVEFEITCRDGNSKRVSVSGRARFDQDGGFERSHCVLWDVTERRRAEHALRESEELHRTLVETMNEGLAMHDPDGHITYVNQRVCELLGVERESLIGQPILSLLEDESRRLMREQMADLSGRGPAQPYELIWSRLDGRTVTTLVSPAHLRDADGEVRATITVITDISELKRTAEMLETTATALESQRRTLDEKDAALKQVFDHLEQEKAAYKKHICADIELELKPLLEAVMDESPPQQQGRIHAAAERLEALLSQDVDPFLKRFAELSPREREVCQLIREGMSSKEMSQRLNLSLLTIHKHRENIRRKLKVRNKDINLSTYLHFR